MTHEQSVHDGFTDEITDDPPPVTVYEVRGPDVTRYVECSVCGWRQEETFRLFGLHRQSFTITMDDDGPLITGEKTAAVVSWDVWGQAMIEAYETDVMMAARGMRPTGPPHRPAGDSAYVTVITAAILLASPRRLEDAITSGSEER